MSLAVLTANFLSFLRAQARASSGRLVESDLWLEARTGIGGMNRVALKRTPTKAEIEEVARVAGNGLLIVLPEAEHPLLNEALPGLGFRIARDSPQMTCVPTRGGFEGARLVGDASELELWRRVAATAYPFGGERTPAARQMLAAIFPQPSCRFYLRFEAAAPVSCALVLVQQNTAGLYWLASDPNWQRQGHARALVRAIQSDLAVLGVELLGLQSSDQALSLYKSLGFFEVGRLRAWEQSAQ